MFYVEYAGFTMTISDSYVQAKSKTGSGAVTFERENLNSEIISISLSDAENCAIEPNVMTAKVSYFFEFAETSIVLFFK